MALGPAAALRLASPSAERLGVALAAPASPSTSQGSLGRTEVVADARPPRAGAGRPGGAHADKAKPSKSPSAKASAAPARARPAAPSADPAGEPRRVHRSTSRSVDGQPGTKWLQKFAAFTCPTASRPPRRWTTQEPAAGHLRRATATSCCCPPPLIEGTQLKKAEAGIPQNQVQWVVNLTFDSTARKTFADVTRQIANQTSPLTGQQKQFAIVLDGKVISAPTVNGAIPNGQAEISGNFSAEVRADPREQPQVRRAAAEVRRSPW
jgi:preprotein translocase subunit SecD